MARRRGPDQPRPPQPEHIVDIDVSDEMRQSFLEYAYSVIFSRALPDARDGLKPVQRRILFQMAQMGLRPDRGHVKSARVVGEVMGRLHPHGDSAIYDALVRMSQPFSLRLPMVDGHGNFGSLDDGPAAMRYTECRLASPALDMTASLDEDVVDFLPNYDGRETEPSVLPAALPNLLVNGAAGIAVGMATNMPPHNLGEVDRRGSSSAGPSRRGHRRADAIRARPGSARRRYRSWASTGIRDAFETGRGSFRMRSTARIEQLTPRRKGIVVTELPYNVGPERVIERIKALVQSKKLQGIADLVDLTDGEHGLRLELAVKTGFHAEAVLAELYRLTPMEEQFSVNNVTLVEGQPRVLGAEGAAGGVPRPPDGRGAAALAVPPRPRRRAAAPRRRPAHRDPRHRRGDRHRPRQRRCRDRARAADAGVRPVAGPGQLHPRHAAAPADEVLPYRAGDRARRAAGRDRGPRGHPGQRGPAAGGRLRGARRRGRAPRHAPAHRPAGVGALRGDAGRGSSGGLRRPLLGAAQRVGAVGADRFRRRATAPRGARRARCAGLGGAGDGARGRWHW